MGVGPDEYKDTLRLFASGVTIVTVASHGKVHGMTASSFASLSLDPPLVLVCLEKGSRTRAMVIQSHAFAVNVLSAAQETVAHAFSKVGEKHFDHLAHRPGRHGEPLLDDAIAWIQCDVQSIVDGGDHDIVIGEVVECYAREGPPLLYFDRRYRSLEPQPGQPTID
jgi:flavin reductase (DIM6/NTAB) family NADH-FMN oxidoreductase RutF